MHTHRTHPLRRHNDPVTSRLVRSLIFLLSALLLATAVFGFLRDAEAQMVGYSLPSGTGGLNYFSNGGYGYGYDRSGGMLNLGIQTLNMGNQAAMQRQYLATQQEMQRRQHVWQSQEIHKFRQWQEGPASRGTWSPEGARANWGMDQ